MMEFTLPDLGEGLSEAVITEWLVRAGVTATRGTPVLAVETAKAVVEIPAPCDLRLESQARPAGATVKVGETLFLYRTDAPASAAVASGSIVGQLAPSPESAGEDRPFLPGSVRYPRVPEPGHDGRTPVNAATDVPPVPTLPTPGLRQQMARRLSSAHREVALVSVFDEARWRPGQPPGTARLVRAVCAAVRTAPFANAWWQDEALRVREDIRLGIAVDTSYGLVVPVLARPDTLNQEELEQRLADLILRAREGRLKPDETRDATLSLSSYGNLGGIFATPLVTPPQVAILGVGHLIERPRPTRRGRWKPCRYLPLSLSFDHRALSGGEGIRFLKAVMAALEAVPAHEKGRH